MYATVQFIHSYWAYLVLIVLFVAAINAIIGYASNKEYAATNFRIALFTLITAHIQVLIGIVLYFVSPYFSVLLEEGMGKVMPDPTLRLYILEHPLMMIIAVALITIGYSKHKSKLTSKPKFKTLAIFYTLGLLIMLSRIPWSAWF